jgi:hypothetical protein
VAFITAISAYTIASAREDEALNIAGEVSGNAARRLGYQVLKSFDEINKSVADNLIKVLMRSIGNIRGTALGEGLAIRTVSELALSSQRLTGLLEQEAKSIKDYAESQIGILIKTAGYRADDFGMPNIVLTATAEEKKAAGLKPVLVKDVRELGYDGYNDLINNLSDEIKNKYKVTGVADRDEAAKLINGKNSMLDIKYIIDSQNREETSFEGLTAFFNQLKEAGIITF